MVAQRFGFTLERIRQELDRLPKTRAPAKADWARVAKAFRGEIDARIETLERMRDTLDGCIGCGCLSLDTCKLYNRGDKAAGRGPGPRYLMGDRSGDIADP